MTTTPRLGHPIEPASTVFGICDGSFAEYARVNTDKLAPAVDRTYPLGEAAAAIRSMLDGRARGKVLISVPA